MGIRVFLADDHPVVREGLWAIFAGAGMEVVGQAAEGRQAVAAIRELRPQVAVVDVALPGLSGIELCRRVRRRLPEVQVVLVSMFDDPAWRGEAAQAGAAAYVLKGEDPDHLVRVVRRAASGEVTLPAADGEGLPLSPREREVVQLIVEGKKLSQVAEALCRSRSTVRAHKAAAMRKLGAHSTAELVRAALNCGLVRTPKLGEV
ncbi:MAG: response regulator [Candidatus Bipolaricaulaceae bacterium]